MNTRPLAALLLVVAPLAAAAPIEKGKGKKMSIELEATTLPAVLRLVSDISKLNVVALDPGPESLKVVAKDSPWDVVLDDVVKQAGLEARREGSLVLVGRADKLAARAPLPSKAGRLTVIVRGALVGDALEMTARASGFAASASGGTPLTVTLRNLPADGIAALLLELSGGVKAERPAPATGCAMPEGKAKTIGVAVGVVTPTAIIADEKSHTFVVDKTSCVGAGKVAVKHITQAGVGLSDGSKLELAE